MVRVLRVQGRPGQLEGKPGCGPGGVWGARLPPESRPVTEMKRGWAAAWLANGDSYPLPRYGQRGCARGRFG